VPLNDLTTLSNRRLPSPAIAARPSSIGCFCVYFQKEVLSCKKEPKNTYKLDVIPPST
jgi:hypothetical protein